MTANYVLHPEAFNDLSEIWSFIAQDSFENADRVIEAIRDTIHFLVNHPRIGHRRDDITSLPLHFHRVYSYLIVYAPEETPLLVVAIVHGKRSPQLIASILRGRN